MCQIGLKRTVRVQTIFPITPTKKPISGEIPNKCGNPISGTKVAILKIELGLRNK
jgi:hypothetical protein